ncbi:hypothetical protein MtrunA17_Chr0c01g0489131 [Medicago truncatula]|uniref:Uncharacterized protein n=1 Tax=Medicago truncatula TaxID=3880 RepID=A0A396GAK1_MEDTR|nr:hypothetical protein MtrunA17_Chr0c01g0489131 [Medicago truncatula]
MPAKNPAKIQPLSHFFGTLCLQGKFTHFSTKLEMAHQAYIGGAPCWGMAGAPPQALPNRLLPLNLPHFHQFELLSSIFFDKLATFDEFGGDLV